jgi:deoxycytidylate deaminase
MREEDKPRKYRMLTAGARVYVTTYTCRTCGSQIIVQKDDGEHVSKKDKEGNIIPSSKW